MKPHPPNDFVPWLESVTCTAPFTIADAKELFDLIHKTLTPWPDTCVDVYTTRGDVVHVRVATVHGCIERDLPIV